MEFTYFDKQNDDCYQKELLSFLNLKEDGDIFNQMHLKIMNIYTSFTFDLSTVYELMKKEKHLQFFTSQEYLFLVLFSYDYLYLFGPLLYSILNHLDYTPHYDKLLEKLNHI